LLAPQVRLGGGEGGIGGKSRREIGTYGLLPPRAAIILFEDWQRTDLRRGYRRGAGSDGEAKETRTLHTTHNESSSDGPGK